MDWYHDVRRYLKSTGLELIADETCRKITYDQYQKIEEQLQKIESERLNEGSKNLEEGLSFLLIKLLGNNKTRSLTRKQIKELEKKEVIASENVKTYFEKFMNHVPVLGKGFVVKDETNDRNEHAVQFERIRKLLNSRNSIDTWLLNKDTPKKKNWKILLQKKQWNSLNEVIEAKKRELFEKTKKDLQTLSARQYQPSI